MSRCRGPAGIASGPGPIRRAETNALRFGNFFYFTFVASRARALSTFDFIHIINIRARMPVGGTTHTHIRGIVVLRRVVVIIYNNNIIIASAIKRVHTGWSPGSVRDVKYGRPCARASTAGRTGFTVFLLSALLRRSDG